MNSSQHILCAKKTAIIFLCLFGAIFIESCSEQPLTLKPFRPKINIKFLPPIIQSSDYHFLEIPIDTLSSLALQRDFVEIEGCTSGNVHFLTSFQNPFRVISKDENNSFRFSVQIVVERVAYDPVIKIKNYLAMYPLLGFVVLGKIANSKDMAAYVQYRYFIIDSKGITVDSFVVITTSSGSPQLSSRKELLEQAHLLAAIQFSNLLVSRLNDIGLIQVQSQIVNYDSPSKRRLRYLDMMKSLISGVQKK